MKNRGGWLAAVIMIPLVIVVCILCIKEAKTMGKPQFVMMGQAKLRNTIEIPVADIDNLELKYKSKNLKFYPTEGDCIIIKEYLMSDEEIAECKIQDRRAVIKGKDVFSFIFFGGGEKIEVYLPQAGLKVLSIETASGNIAADEGFEIQLKELDVAAASGNIKWKRTTAEKVAFAAASGNIHIREIQAQETDIATASGNIDAEDVTGSFAFAASSGNIKAIGMRGYGDAATSSGGIKIEMEEVEGDISLKASSGGVKLLLPKELSFELEVKTGSGNIHTDYDNNLSYNKKGNHASGIVGAEATCRISAEAGSGSVRVEQNL